jgi:hypothetical protein
MCLDKKTISSIRMELVAVHLLLSYQVYCPAYRYSKWLWAKRPRDGSSNPSMVKNFHFSRSPRPVLGPTLPPIQWIPGGFEIMGSTVYLPLTIQGLKLWGLAPLVTNKSRSEIMRSSVHLSRINEFNRGLKQWGPPPYSLMNQGLKLWGLAPLVTNESRSEIMGSAPRMSLMNQSLKLRGLPHLSLMNQSLKLWGLLSTRKSGNVSMHLWMVNQNLNLCDLLSSVKCNKAYVYVINDSSSQVRLWTLAYVHVRLHEEEPRAEVTWPVEWEMWPNFNFVKWDNPVLSILTCSEPERKITNCNRYIIMSTSSLSYLLFSYYFFVVCSY